MRITRNGYADDELLHYPTLHSQLFQTTHDKLLGAGITSYSKLVEIVSDDSAEPDIRATAVWTVNIVLKALDKRQIIKPLLKVLDSSHEEVRNAAVHSLSWFKSHQVVSMLVDLACDKQESLKVRLLAIQGLSSNKNTEYFNRLRTIMFDETDDIRSRSEALEWVNYPHKVNPVSDFIQLLQHPQPDLRFWAAYRLSQEHRDISQALSALDNVAAFDHNLPTTWGWHIDREALPSLETIFWKRLGLKSIQFPHQPMYLISLAPEYQTFDWRFCIWQDGGTYKKLPTPHIAFRIESNWLVEKLQEKWPTIKLDIREPKPQTYLVNWLIRINNSPLMGGLHRDQYSIVITGNQKTIRTFAAWYRSIVEPTQYLFLYEWADLAVELRAGMSAADVEAEQVERGKDMSAVYEKTIQYPWVIETE